MPRSGRSFHEAWPVPVRAPLARRPFQSHDNTGGGWGTLSKMPDSCVRRKTGTATNSRLWNWLAVPGLPTADTPPVAHPIFIPPDEVHPHNATDTDFGKVHRKMS